MYTFYKEFNSFIDERFNNNFSRLKNTKDYKKTQQKYRKLLDEFNLTLSREGKNKLDTILSLQNSLNAKELDFIYIIGLTDGIKLCK